MQVQLLVTRNDFCLPNLTREFDDLGIDYAVEFIEEHPELVSEHNIRHSPNILVDGELVFKYQPTQLELREYFGPL